jgi:glycosyltransferase involved in cell wall biosynthesis
MQNQGRILFGITSFSHTELGLREMYGLRDLGYTCDRFEFGAKKHYESIPARAWIILLNALNLLIRAYQFKPDFIYLNSRLDFKGPVRDFITILFIRIFYYKKVFFFIKSHGSDLEVLQTRKFIFRKIIFPYLNRQVNAWLFLSNEELQWITNRHLLNPDRLFLSKNIIHTEQFLQDPGFRKQYNIPEDHKILLFAGRMIREKGIFDIVDAFAGFPQQHKATLIMVGDGEEFTKLKAAIENRNIKGRIILPGWLSEDEVASFTANSDILIFPTYFPEGFPMALFNAAGAGLSIITTPTRAALDYLKEPDNCLWVEPKNPASVTSALEKLYNFPGLMNAMSQNNRQLANLFSQQQVARELSSMLESVKENQSRIPQYV